MFIFASLLITQNLYVEYSASLQVKRPEGVLMLIMMLEMCKTFKTIGCLKLGVKREVNFRNEEEEVAF